MKPARHWLVVIRRLSSARPWLLWSCFLLVSPVLVAGSIPVRDQLWAPPNFSVRMELNLAPHLIEAVEAHVALNFLLSLQCADRVDEQRFTLYLAPLTRRYRLSDGFGNEREFALRSEALAGMERVSVQMLDCLEAMTFRYRLNLAELPSALRVPALLQASWQLDTGWQRVEPVRP